MKHDSPQISVCATCYNHEKYIPFFMEKLLEQDFQDWELIVTDDCSTDGSYDLLKTYCHDPRVHVYKNDRNRHVCQTANHSFAKARGKYVCIISTDDAIVEGKLAHDVAYLDAHPEVAALYNNLIPIREDNTFISDPKQRWAHCKLDRWQILNHLFTKGNCMMIPGLVVRRESMQAIGLMNPLLCLTQDYEYHMRLLLHGEMAISDRPLTYYRRRDDEMNLSAGTEKNENNGDNEIALLLEEEVRRINGLEQFRRIFPEFNKYSELRDEDIVFYTGLLLVESPRRPIRAAGLKMLYDFVLRNVERLEQQYDFLAKDLMAITRKVYAYNEILPDRAALKKPLDKLIYKIWHSMRRKLKRRGII